MTTQLISGADTLVIEREEGDSSPILVYLLPEDLEILKEMPKAIDPELYFFRDPKNGNSGKTCFKNGG